MAWTDQETRNTGSYDMEQEYARMKRSGRYNMIWFVVIIGGFLLYTLLRGQTAVGLTASEERFGVYALSGDTITVEYTEMEDIALEPISALEFGTLSAGEETRDCLSGTYTNEAFGEYQLHINRTEDATECIVVRHSGGVLVCNSTTDEETERFYEAVLEMVEG
ncbi:MAG: hypothetical protein LUE95_02455 [Oscillospiraceae bacterium]|nr:hypothetical protein [Oscillospiraceae bacterium]MCC8157078.1 hypothetical protein [Oscillospiraceae bacterium]MCD7742903.1 hypothetical protein [Oscillospiraceae bacterium]MCD7786354.1 hypothetical protein [Oscillospiraceae bacterium]MCD8001441.1 hypothetical protein [Oscillospiraceae bacterium]